MLRPPTPLESMMLLGCGSSGGGASFAVLASFNLSGLIDGTEIELLVNNSLRDSGVAVSGALLLETTLAVDDNVKLRVTSLPNNDCAVQNVTLDGAMTFASFVIPGFAHRAYLLPEIEMIGWQSGTATDVTFSMTDITAHASLVNNLDAKALTGFANGDPVDTWTNKTGGTNATASGSSRAVYQGSGFFGQPALDFSGTQNYAQSLSGYVSGEYTVLFVAKLDTVGGTHRGLMVGPSNNPYLTMFGAKMYGYNGVIVTAFDTHQFAEPLLAGLRVNPTGKIILNGLTQLASDASGNTNLAVSTISSSAFPWDGAICQVLMFNDDIDYGELRDVIRVLQAKWQFASRYIICDGDSLTRGLGSTSGTGYPTMLQAMRGVTENPVRNFGGDSQTLANMSSDAATSIDRYATNIGYTGNILVAWGGSNDLYFGATAATTISRFEDYCLGRRSAGLVVIACTIIDHTESGGSWTAAGAATVNASIRANWGDYASALCDLAADSRLADKTNLTYFQPDQVHLTDAGYAVVAALVDAAINSIYASEGIA